MIRKTILAIPAMALLLAAGCSNSDTPTLQQTIGIPAVNLVTPQQSGAESFFQKTSYLFERKVYENLVKVGGSVSVDNVNYKFSTSDLQSIDISYGQFGGFRFSAPYATIANSDRRVQSLQGYATSWINNPYTLQLTVAVPSFPTTPYSENAAVISYEIPSLCSVKSFPFDAYYSGITQTSFGSETAESKDIVIRVVLADDLKTASVVMYNAKFAPGMPAMTLVAKNLTLKAGNGTYTLTGADIIPEDVNGTPYRSFPFKNFEMKPSSDDLTKVNIDFQVGSKYSAKFTGSYVRELPR